MWMSDTGSRVLCAKGRGAALPADTPTLSGSAARPLLHTPEQAVCPSVCSKEAAVPRAKTRRADVPGDRAQRLAHTHTRAQLKIGAVTSFTINIVAILTIMNYLIIITNFITQILCLFNVPIELEICLSHGEGTYFLLSEQLPPKGQDSTVTPFTRASVYIHESKQAVRLSGSKGSGCGTRNPKIQGCWLHS